MLTFHERFMLAITYEARTLLGLGVFWCRTRVVSDTDTTPTLVITMNNVFFFLQIISCVSVSVSVSLFVLHMLLLAKT